MAGSDGSPDEQAEHVEPEHVEAERGGTERVGTEPGETATPAARRGTAWVILGVVAAALVICCCSAVVGAAIAWSAGLFDAR
ncbi:MAG: hypothetical protein WA890_04070 [Micromonospora sp.]